LLLASQAADHFDGVLIAGLGSKGVELAERGAHQCRERDDGVSVSHQLANQSFVAAIASNDVERVVGATLRQRRLVKHKVIDNRHPMALSQ
jgi:hypothetical protein